MPPDPSPAPVSAVVTAVGPTGAFPVTDEMTGSVLKPDSEAPVDSVPSPLVTVIVGVTVTVTAGAQAAEDGTLLIMAVETTVAVANDVEAGSGTALEDERTLEHFFLPFEEEVVLGRNAAEDEDEKTLEHFFLLFEETLVGTALAADDAGSVKKKLPEPEAEYAAAEEALALRVRVGKADETERLVAMASVTEEVTIEEARGAGNIAAALEEGDMATVVELATGEALEAGTGASSPGPETEVVRSPLSMYTPLNNQSSGASSMVEVAPGRRRTPTCQSAPF